MYLVIVATIWISSPNKLTLHNSFLFRLIPYAPPCKKALYNEDYLNCHNPNLGLATKAKAGKGAGQE